MNMQPLKTDQTSTKLQNFVKEDKSIGLIFFCDYFIIGGVEQVLVTACNALADAGYDVLIVWTGFVQDNFILRQISPKVKQFYALSALKLEYLPKPKKPFWKRKFWKLKRKINDYKLRDIGKHIENFEHYKYLIDFKNGYSRVAKIKSVPGQKKIVWLHGSSTLFFEANIFAANNLFTYDKLVCLTKEFRQFFIKKYPQYESRIVHIYNPFDIQEIRNKSLEDLPEIRQYLPYFLHVSRLDNDKDITTVIKACKLFYADGKRRTKTIFLGDGMKLQTYKDKVKDESLEKDVFFLGNSDNPYPWMKQAEALFECVQQLSERP